MQKKRNCTIILFVLIGVLSLGIAVADGVYDFNISHDDVNVDFYGRVDYVEYLVAPDTVTYFAHLDGSDKEDITYSDAAVLTISKKNGDEIYKKRFYYSTDSKTMHTYTTQSKVYTSSIKVEVKFGDTTEVETIN